MLKILQRVRPSIPLGRVTMLGMRAGELIVCAAVATLGLSASTHAAKFIVFDPVGSASTDPTSISNGAITGTFTDSKSIVHGFLRSVDGTITEFDPSGSISTAAGGIDKYGAIAGHYTDSNNVTHGYVRAANGTITSFDAPGSIYTITGPINNGLVSGDWEDNYGYVHGFVRAADGTITEFDPPGSLFTVAPGVNKYGTVAGRYCNAQNLGDCNGPGVIHGFVRAVDGTITSFDPPRSIYTAASVINDDGTITGYYQSRNGLYHDFLRAADGTITIVRGKGLGVPYSINNKGWIAGTEFTNNLGFRGFVRAADGNITTFNVPGADHQRTSAQGVDDNGAITGYYDADNNLHDHGFLRSR